MLILQLSLMPAICSAFLIMLRCGTICPCDAYLAIFSSNASWQTLYFLPLPHQHGSFLPIFTDIIFLFSTFLIVKRDRAKLHSVPYFFIHTVFVF